MKKSFVIQFTFDVEVQENKEIYEIIETVKKALTHKVPEIDAVHGGSIMHVFDTNN